MSVLDADDDWIESVRRFYYPKLHPYLELFGGYGVGTVKDAHRVTTLAADEEVIEEELVEIGFRRNPVAAFKSHTDGRESEGSWVLLPADDPMDRLDKGKQTHITLLPRRDGKPGREIYAHMEYDWRTNPYKHLLEIDLEPQEGVAHTKLLLDDYTYFNA